MEIQRVGRRPSPVSDPQGPGRGGRRRSVRALLPDAALGTGSPGRPKAPAQVAPSWPSGLYGELIASVATPTELPRKGREPRPPSFGRAAPPVPPQVSPAFTVLSGLRGMAGGGSGEAARGASGRRAKLGACSTRLETRTKESNGPASQGATETPRRNEGEGRFGRPRWDPAPSGAGAPPPRHIRSVRCGGGRAGTLGPERW